MEAAAGDDHRVHLVGAHRDRLAAQADHARLVRREPGTEEGISARAIEVAVEQEEPQ